MSKLSSDDIYKLINDFSEFIKSQGLPILRNKYNFIMFLQNHRGMVLDHEPKRKPKFNSMELFEKISDMEATLVQMIKDVDSKLNRIDFLKTFKDDLDKLNKETDELLKDV